MNVNQHTRASGHPLTVMPIFGTRPEHMELASGDEGVVGEVVVVEPTGADTQVFTKLAGIEVTSVFRERHAFRPGDIIRLRPDPARAHLFDEPFFQERVHELGDGRALQSGAARDLGARDGAAVAHVVEHALPVDGAHRAEVRRVDPL